MPESAVERHGIFVGNATKPDRRGQPAGAVTAAADADRLAIDGIRIYGFLGPMAYVTRNDLTGFPTGIRFAALNNTTMGATSMWRIVDNIADGARRTVDMSLKFGNTYNAVVEGNVP